MLSVYYSFIFPSLKAVVIQSSNMSWISLSFQLTESKVLAFLCVKMDAIFYLFLVPGMEPWDKQALFVMHFS